MFKYMMQGVKFYSGKPFWFLYNWKSLCIQWTSSTECRHLFPWLCDATV